MFPIGGSGAITGWTLPLAAAGMRCLSPPLTFRSGKSELRLKLLTDEPPATAGLACIVAEVAACAMAGKLWS